MKKFIISIIFIVLGVFVVDRIGGKVMFWVFQHTNNSSSPKMRYLIHDCNEEVVFLGTSRSNSHYVPSIIRDSLNLSVYNGGFTGSGNIFSHYIVLNHLLDNHQPNVICLDLYINDLTQRNEQSFRSTAFFAPYFGRNERADSIYRLSGMYWPYKLCHLYRYNAKAVHNIAGLAIRTKVEIDGYKPLPCSRGAIGKIGHLNSTKTCDSLKIDYLNKIIYRCKEEGVKLIFVVSPAYSKVDSDCYAPLTDIAKNNGIPLLNYHTNGLFHTHPEYFRDETHLCDIGACMFSSIVAQDLKHIICNDTVVCMRNGKNE